LKDPVSWRFSSFSITGTASDATSGVCRITPSMRCRASRMSSRVG